MSDELDRLKEHIRRIQKVATEEMECGCEWDELERTNECDEHERMGEIGRKYAHLPD